MERVIGFGSLMRTDNANRSDLARGPTDSLNSHLVQTSKGGHTVGPEYPRTATNARVSGVQQSGPLPEKHAKNAENTVFFVKTSTPDRSRTCGLRFRKAPLYPAELRGRCRDCIQFRLKCPPEIFVICECSHFRAVSQNSLDSSLKHSCWFIACPAGIEFETLQACLK